MINKGRKGRKQKLNYCANASMSVVLEGPNRGPSMSKQWNLKSALEIHMINTHFEAGGAAKFLLPGPL